MRKLLTSVFCAAAALIGAGQAAIGEENPPQPAESARAGPPGASLPPAEKAGPPAAAGGMMVHIDPRTGAIQRDPAPGTQPLQLSPQLRNAVSTSHQGLVEVPGAAPGGGVKVDLQGRFQSPLVMTIDPDGKARTQHLGEPPASGDRK
jgi:hypothetical protein